MTKQYMFIFLALFSLLAASFTAQAERREDGAADAMRKAQIMIRKLSKEKSELQKKNAELDTQLKEIEDKIASMESDLGKTRKKLGKAEKNNDRLVGRIRGDVDKYKQLLGKYRETTQTLRNSMSDNRLLVNAVQERDDWIGQCGTQNEKMFEANLDLLDSYKNRSVTDVLKGKEPILGLGRVELETRVQDYRFRLEDLTVTPFQPATPLPSQASNGVSLNSGASPTP